MIVTQICDFTETTELYTSSGGFYGRGILSHFMEGDSISKIFFNQKNECTLPIFIKFKTSQLNNTLSRVVYPYGRNINRKGEII